MLRNNPVLHIRDTNPCATLEEIGGMTGLSRQRVHQILRKAGRPTARTPVQRSLCRTCGVDIGTSRTKRRHCSRQCQFEAKHMWLTCTECGQENHYLVSTKATSTASYSFCSRKCQGRYLGKHFGRGRKNEASGCE